MTTQEEAYKDLEEFIKEMVEVMGISKDKYGDFTKHHPTEFLEHLQEEVDEVVSDVSRGRLDEASEEAIDVANMAFMIWWKCKHR